MMGKKKKRPTKGEELEGSDHEQEGTDVEDKVEEGEEEPGFLVAAEYTC
jgi:hypothetical protein